MLKLSGIYDAEHLMRELIAKESAFSCIWDHVELRVAHRKGTWRMVKMWGGEVLDVLDVSDNGAVTSTSTMLTGLISEKIKDVCNLSDRWPIAGKFVEAIAIWVAHPQDVREVKCVKYGRNSWLDEDSGRFLLDAPIV